MTILERPKLGTDKVHGWMYYDLHFASSYVFGEALLVGNYRSCIERAETAQAAGLGAWARKMGEQGYHELYTRAFISMWSVFETGLENMVATYLQSDITTARAALANASKACQAKHLLSEWPWTREACLRITTDLENQAKKATARGGADLFGRLKTMVGWLDVHVEDKPGIAAALAEANRVRNIILHRYGEVADSDVAAIPSLHPSAGRIIQMTIERFRIYNIAISETIIAIMDAVSKSRHAPRKIGV